MLALFGWYAVPKPFQRIVGWLSARFYRFYSQRYFELSGLDAAGVDQWMTVMVAARIDDDIQEEHEHLVRYVRERLAAGL